MGKAWAASLILCACGGSELRPGGFVIYINEVMAANDSTIYNEHLDDADWIELYNGGDQAASLEGLFLAKRIEDPSLSPLPDIELQAGDFLLLWADNKDEDYHVSFTLNAAEDSVALFYLDPDEGGDPNLFDAITFGPLDQDVSYGRVSDGGPDWDTLSAPSPGTSNNDAVSDE